MDWAPYHPQMLGQYPQWHLQQYGLAQTRVQLLFFQSLRDTNAYHHLALP